MLLGECLGCFKASHNTVQEANAQGIEALMSVAATYQLEGGEAATSSMYRFMIPERYHEAILDVMKKP